MRTLLASLAVLSSLGCDSPGLVANVETFLCGVIPWYAADCTDPEVQARALSVLENGIVQAEAVCVYQVPGNNNPCGVIRAKADLFQDGASIVESSAVGYRQQFNSRHDPVKVCTNIQCDFSSVEFVGGVVQYELYCGGPVETGSFDIATYCTGFNLEAFD